MAGAVFAPGGVWLLPPWQSTVWLPGWCGWEDARWGEGAVARYGDCGDPQVACKVHRQGTVMMSLEEAEDRSESALQPSLSLYPVSHETNYV